MKLLTLPTLISWWWQSCLILGLAWGFYQLVLRREPGFGYNRHYLRLAPVLALVLPPLLSLATTGLTRWLPQPAASATAPSMPTIMLPAIAVSGQVQSLNAAAGLLGLYLAVAALLLGRLSWQLLQLWRLGRRLPRQPHAGYSVLLTRGQLPISSFGRWVFWDETAPLTPAEAQLVLRHEVAHVTQGHSFDRLALELLRIVLWLNPFVHLFPRALELTHEYLADEAVLGREAPPAAATAYGALLARLTLLRLTPCQPLVHSFTYSQTLNRIAMLKPAHPVRRWKQWLALPTTAALLLTLAVVNVACQSVPPPPPPAMIAPPPPPPPAVSDVAPPPPPPPPALENVDQMPEYPGGQTQLMQDISSRLQYPAAAKAAKLGGKVFIEFVVSPQGHTTSVRLRKGITAPGHEAEAQALNEAALQVVRSLTVDWKPATLNGKPVAVSFVVPITFDPHLEPHSTGMIYPFQRWDQVFSAC